MAKVSFIIPSRSEKFENLGRTIQSIIDNAKGEYEILVGLDEANQLEIDDITFKFPSVRIIPFPGWVGIKTNINTLAALATGKYIFKADAHCSFGEGIDEILKADMQDDRWIVMPRFYVLNGATWQWQDDRHYDYFYLSCPFTDPRGFRFKAGGHWPQLTAERELDHQYDLDITPQIHGSGWFMTKDRFFQLGGFPITDPYGHAQEPANLALKNWLMGGKVATNKKTWYAHLHQDVRAKGFQLRDSDAKRTYHLTATYWMADRYFAGKVHNMEWFLNKFMPMPTWPDNWKEVYADWKKDNRI